MSGDLLDSPLTFGRPEQKCSLHCLGERSRLCWRAWCRGINLANALEAPAEGVWGVTLEEEYFQIIVTVHYYNPFPFTHQGAGWVSGSHEWTGTRWGTEADKQAVVADFDSVAAWAGGHNRPIYVGEFGAYWKAEREDRVLWIDFVARRAEARGMSWAYWEFAPASARTIRCGGRGTRIC